MTEKEAVLESKLVPVLREGVEVIKMILFLKLKEHCSAKKTKWSKEYQGKIIGAVINEIFGVVSPDQVFVEFARENEAQVIEVMNEIPVVFDELLVTLTDALRIMVLCDLQEGIDNSKILERAEEKGVLLTERDMPMPHTFIDLVRRLASYYGLYTAPAEEVT